MQMHAASTPGPLRPYTQPRPETHIVITSLMARGILDLCRTLNGRLGMLIVWLPLTAWQLGREQVLVRVHTTTWQTMLTSLRCLDKEELCLQRKHLASATGPSWHLWSRCAFCYGVVAVLLACVETFMPLPYGASQPWLAVVGIALSSAAYHAGRMQPVFTGEGKAAFLSRFAK